MHVLDSDCGHVPGMDMLIACLTMLVLGLAPPNEDASSTPSEPDDIARAMRDANEHANELLEHATEELERALEEFERAAVDLKTDAAAHELRRMTKLNLARLYLVTGNQDAARAVVDDVVRDDRGLRRDAKRLGPQLETLYDSRVTALEDGGHAQLHVICARPCEVLINESPAPTQSPPLPLGSYRVVISTTDRQLLRTTYDVDLVKPDSIVEVHFPPATKPSPPPSKPSPPKPSPPKPSPSTEEPPANEPPPPQMSDVVEMDFDEAVAALERGLELAKEDPEAGPVVLDVAIRALRKHPVELAADPYVQRLRILGLLSLAAKSQSPSRIQEALRCSLGTPLPVAQFGPQLRQLYESELTAMQSRSGVILIECETPCRVYVNENLVPDRIEGVPDGIYRVYAESVDGSLPPKYEELRVYPGVTTLVRYGRHRRAPAPVFNPLDLPSEVDRPLPPLPPLHEPLDRKHRAPLAIGATLLAAGGLALGLLPVPILKSERQATLALGIGGPIGLLTGIILVSRVSVSRRKARNPSQ